MREKNTQENDKNENTEGDRFEYAERKRTSK